MSARAKGLQSVGSSTAWQQLCEGCERSKCGGSVAVDSTTVAVSGCHLSQASSEMGVSPPTAEPPLASVGCLESMWHSTLEIATIWVQHVQSGFVLCASEVHRQDVTMQHKAEQEP